MDRLAQLAEFMETQYGAPGPWNCSTMPADWCISLGHPDFAAAWRSITDPAECARYRRLLRFWRSGIGDALPVVRDLEPGDIGVVRAHRLESGAIWTGERWALKLRRGVLFKQPSTLRLLRAWRP